MKRCTLLLLLAVPPLLVAALPIRASAQSAVPLVVGSVRDQTGAPVNGARVSLLQPPRTVAEGSTAADGTFALAATGATVVEIRCPFCRALSIAVHQGEPVVAIVQRYRALLHDGPDPLDLDALPYAHAESAASLTPFVVLADSSGVFPGTVLSDRGLSRAGGLVIDNGVPDYDVAANASPFFTIPARSLELADAEGARAASRYGDRADAGTFAFAPPGGATTLSAGTGSDAFANAHVQNGASAYDAAVSGNAMEHRARLDVQSAQMFTDASIDETASLGVGTVEPFPEDRVAQSFASARVSAQLVRAQRRYAEAFLDRGSYQLDLPTTEVGSQWSDAAVRAGIETLGAANWFFEAGVRRSNGYYDAGGRIPTIAAGINQFSVVSGLRSDFEKTSIHATIAAYQIGYSGGPLDPEYASPANDAGTSLIAPSLDAQFRPNEHWNVDVTAASTFRLPTLLERYARPPASGLLEIDRNGLLQTTLAYSDRARMRAAVTAYRQHTNGFDSGSVSGIGASLAWQIAPRLALRSWMLRETDTTRPVVKLVRFTPSAVAGTVGSAWLTYELPAFRIDAIYRRDLLDTIAVPHFDYAISGSAGGRTRWFVGSEVRHGARFTGFGLRL